MTPLDASARAPGPSLRPRLLALHGTASAGDALRPLARLLGDRVGVLAPDRRGTPAHPLSPGDPLPSIEDHARDAARAIRESGEGPAHLLGVSFGAAVALEVVLREPALVRSATLFEPGVALEGDDLPGPRALLAALEEHLAQGRPDEAVAAFHRRVLPGVWERLSAEAQARAAALASHIRSDLRAIVPHRVAVAGLAEIRTPVLLVHGARTRAAFSEATARLHARIPGALLEVLPDVGHALTGRALAALARSLQAFLP